MTELRRAIRASRKRLDGVPFEALSRAFQTAASEDLTRWQDLNSVSPLDGGRSSMVEPQIVVLVVAGSSPVGHPISVR